MPAAHAVVAAAVRPSAAPGAPARRGGRAGAEGAGAPPPRLAEQQVLARRTVAYTQHTLKQYHTTTVQLNSCAELAHTDCEGSVVLLWYRLSVPSVPNALAGKSC